ncbi:MAG TPA: KamA family radical SAM protein, partial [Thermoanaerobaculia bacterium]
FVPTDNERLRISDGSSDDRIGEEEPIANPVAAISSFYHDRALFRVTHMCPAYCRYCFRRRMVGDGEGAWNRREIEEGLSFLARTPTVKEVILSGGDPLILSDDRLRYVVESLRAIPHVRRLRIDTKALTMLPQRITANLVAILASVKPFYVIGHFTHPYELTNEVLDACARLVDNGIVVGSHTPMLRGVTDNADVLCDLFERLVDHRVLPYYLIHFIPTPWTEHFRVPLEHAIEIVRDVQARCGGLSVPAFIVYLPDAGGKVVVSPDYLVKKVSSGFVFRSHDGREILYPENLGSRDSS